MQVPVFLGPKTVEGTQVVVGVLPANVLSAYAETAVHKSSGGTTEGYQRPLSATRVNRLSEQLGKRQIDLPTSVTLSLRSRPEDKALIERDGQWFLDLDGHRLYIIDGQHRAGALKLLGDKGTDLKDWLVPFTLLVGTTMEEELNEFHIINSTALSVRTDLAFSLIKQRYASSEKSRLLIAAAGDAWRAEGQALAEGLSAQEVWLGKIRFANERARGLLISNSQLATSLRPLVESTPFFRTLGLEGRLEILKAFWTGVLTIFPEARTTPSEYHLQRRVGVFVLHRLLSDVLEHVRQRQASVAEPSGYVEVLRGTLENFEAAAPGGSIRKGLNFWLAGDDSAADSYRSPQGLRSLYEMVRSSLPDLALSQ